MPRGGDGGPRPLDAPVVDAGVASDAPAIVEEDAPVVVGEDAPVVPGTDGAEIVSVFFPHALGCTARTAAHIVMRNSGTRVWSGDAGYGLGAVGGSDPLHTGETRVRLAAGETVAPGETHEFVVSLAAPGVEGSVESDWQMASDGTPAFGETSTNPVDVWCRTTTAAEFDLSTVTIVASPDVRGFAVTSSITSLSFMPGTIHIDHTLRGTWPPIEIDPVEHVLQEATIWIFFHIGGQWYATGGERLRPSQTDKMLPNPSGIGFEWLYDPGRWGVMTGYTPSPGDLVGFMVVAGSTRSDNSVIVMERTGVVLVPFPADDVPTSFPPFAWTE